MLAVLVIYINIHSHYFGFIDELLLTQLHIFAILLLYLVFSFLFYEKEPCCFLPTKLRACSIVLYF